MFVILFERRDFIIGGEDWIIVRIIKGCKIGFRVLKIELGI